jgi:uncharacterized membrane protein YgcG
VAAGEAKPTDCAACTLMNTRTRPVQCPTVAEVAGFEAAVVAGDIVWHAGPFNWYPKNMAPQLFEAGINMVRWMDRRFYGAAKNTTTMSVRDKHTWGTAGIDGIWGKDAALRNAALLNTTALRNATLLNTDAYAHADAAWAEQRSFGELAVLSLEEAGHALAAAARAEVDLIEHAAAPNLKGRTELPLGTVVQLAGGVELGFGTDGAITRLQRAQTGGGGGGGVDVGGGDGGGRSGGGESEGGAAAAASSWASPESPLGAFTY